MSAAQCFLYPTECMAEASRTSSASRQPGRVEQGSGQQQSCWRLSDFVAQSET